jgi:hypothetical protein
MSVHETGVHLTGVHLTGVHLTGVHLTGVHLTGVPLTGCGFHRHAPHDYKRRHASLAGIYRHAFLVSYTHTSLLGVHLSLACISLKRASHLCGSHEPVCYRGAYYTGRASQKCTSHGMGHLTERAHPTGVCLS